MNEEFKPYIPAEESKEELTFTAIVLGMFLAVIFGAANAYLGLRLGTTISSSIPAAVISMGIIRGVLKRNSILENNIVQS
ncbi:MAG: OPT/YSL family transporter, partial [Synergistaceae bacterium]|nr:OPT/YSL family transporter [Synergistaceae bacterium]